MLRTDDLHTHYGLSHVIQGIDLEARPGEVTGIFGRNGVGKTTLLKTIAGWVRPSSGSVELDGVRLDGREPDAISRTGVGFVPEDRRIFPGLSVEENLALALSRRSGRDPLGAVWKRFPRLSERRRQAGKTLSGGEQQMLAMARAMVGEPRVLLIDEPSEGLAPMIVADVFAIIRELREAGAIVVLVEQNIHEALGVCDHFHALERGRIVLSGKADNEADRASLMKVLAV